jgi:uncharacterized protein YndB with AHSA1/START domain
MSDSTSAAVVPALVMRRHYNAPPARVYAAWTSPAAAAVFLGPGDVKATEIEMDVRAGGKYRIVMVMPDGARMPVRGVYREASPSKRLSMTWRWEEDDPAEERDTLLTLDFIDADGGTDLVLTHEHLASVESRDNHEHGWTAILDALATAV